MAGLRALKGRTMGIIGLGNTGAALAARANAFGMRVLGYRRRDIAAPPGVERVYSTDRGETIDPILAEADVLALVLNLSDATRHLIGARELGLMKPSAVVINLARGEVIDQDALIEALKAGKLAGAGLDVTTPEPLPAGPSALGHSQRPDHAALHGLAAQPHRPLARDGHRKPAALSGRRADAQPRDARRHLHSRPRG